MQGPWARDVAVGATNRAHATRSQRATKYFDWGWWQMIAEVVDGLSRSNDGTNEAAERAVAARVQALCARFPIYPGR